MYKDNSMEAVPNLTLHTSQPTDVSIQPNITLFHSEASCVPRKRVQDRTSPSLPWNSPLRWNQAIPDMSTEVQNQLQHLKGIVCDARKAASTSTGPIDTACARRTWRYLARNLISVGSTGRGTALCLEIVSSKEH